MKNDPTQFMNIYFTPQQKGLFFRIFNIHVQYFRLSEKDALKKALTLRNAFYKEHQILPESLFVRPASPCKKKKSLSGYSQIYPCINDRRRDMATMLAVKLRNLQTSKQTHMRVLLDGKSIKNSQALVTLLALRQKNVVQFNRIVDTYNKIRFVKLLPVAESESKNLIPELYQYNYFDNDLWCRSIERVFKNGLYNCYTANKG